MDSIYLNRGFVIGIILISFFIIFNCNEVDKGNDDDVSIRYIVDTIGDVGKYTDICIDSNNNIWVAYNSEEDGLKLAVFKNSNWSIISVDTNTGSGQYNSIIITNSNIYIGYLQEINTNLMSVYISFMKLAISTNYGKSWNIKVISNAGIGSGMYNKMAFVGDSIYIAYFENCTMGSAIDTNSFNSAMSMLSSCNIDEFNIYRANNMIREGNPMLIIYSNENFSIPIEVKSTIELSNYSGLFIDVYSISNIFGISYYDATIDGIIYKTYINGTWTEPTIICSNRKGTENAMAIADSKLFFVYMNDSSDNLMLSIYSNGIVSNTIVSESDDGYDANFVDVAYRGNILAISFYDSIERNLKLAIKNGNEWKIHQIDSSSYSMGRYNSIAFDQYGNIWIAYYNNANDDLCVAFISNYYY